MINLKKIKFIDYWLGKPICFLLTQFNHFLFKKTKIIHTPRKILFIKFIEQGATVLAYPAIKNATEKVGRVNVYFCVFKSNKPILDILDLIPQDNIYVINDSNLFYFFISIAKTLRQIWKEKIDTVIDMEFFSRASAILSFLTFAKCRIGLHRYTSEAPYRGNLFTHKIAYNPYIHVSSFYNLLVESINHSPNEIPLIKATYLDIKNIPEIRFTEEEKQLLTKIEKELSIRYGFEIKDHFIQFSGRCPDCLKKLDKNSGENISKEN